MDSTRDRSKLFYLLRNYWGGGESLAKTAKVESRAMGGSGGNGGRAPDAEGVGWRGLERVGEGWKSSSAWSLFAPEESRLEGVPRGLEGRVKPSQCPTGPTKIKLQGGQDGARIAFREGKSGSTNEARSGVSSTG
jgi:hypothetical protein